ncbi:MAG: class I SAM-dependent methyltransferase [Thiothrix sp.]|nr:class I SAM-dependent methyltransferase [Thiothrix sp.]
MNKKNCYDHPVYYELAFSFRDIPYEVGVIQHTIKEFSRCEVRSLLELACGPSQHMIELSRHGLQFEGLDINQAMIDYSKEKAKAVGIDAIFHKQSMAEFRLERQVDYVFIALGDLYVRSNEELKSHLCSVASALRQGGLFLLDWCIQFEPAKMFKLEGDSWEVKKDDIHLQAHVVMKPFDHPHQLFEEQLDIEVKDRGDSLSLSSYSVKRAIYPQEFLALIKNMGQFEFIGWWNNWSLDKPLLASTEDIFRPITLLRKL